VSCAALLLAAATAGAAGKSHAPGYVYTLTNSHAGNAVAVFARGDDGTLTPDGTVPTGGLGTGANLGSQGAIVVSGHKLFAVNAGDNSISYFRIRRGGLELQDTIASGGVQPISLTVHGHVLYVLNAGGSGNVTGFAIRYDTLAPLAGSTQPLGAGSSGPAQVSFSPNGKTLIVTEKASSTIDTYAVEHGIAGAPVVTAATGGTPFGFDFDKRGDVLTSNAAGSASSYAVAKNGSLSVISGAVSTAGQAAPCWLVTSKDGRYAYTANAGSGTISGFAVAHDGSLSLLDVSGITGNLGAGSHPLDEIVGRDGKFLHVLVDGNHTVGTFRIDRGGGLTWVGAAGVLPAGDVGLAAS
jgi:6-phosphogluconolactonase (cycloisomerase 2 family)